RAVKVVLIVPVFEDWESASLLSGLIDQAFQNSGHAVTILFVDDGSFSPPDGLLPKQPLRALSEIRILRLCRNVGHQRAIAIGLAWVERQMPCDAVIIM